MSALLKVILCPIDLDDLYLDALELQKPDLAKQRT